MSSDSPPHVIVLEDEPAVRAAVVAQLEASGRYVVDAAVGTIAQATQLVERSAAAFGVFDLELEGGSALPLIPRAIGRGMSVLVLTIWDDDERVFRALTAGASGYLLKAEVRAGAVALALDGVAAGCSAIAPSIARRLLEVWRPQDAPVSSRVQPRTPNASSLSAREREIIELFAKGATYDEVAELLSMSVNTVRHHVRNMYRKLHVCSKAEAVTLALSR